MTSRSFDHVRGSSPYERSRIFGKVDLHRLSTSLTPSLNTWSVPRIESRLVISVAPSILSTDRPQEFRSHLPIRSHSGLCHHEDTSHPDPRGTVVRRSERQSQKPYSRHPRDPHPGEETFYGAPRLFSTRDVGRVVTYARGSV